MLGLDVYERVVNGLKYLLSEVVVNAGTWPNVLKNLKWRTESDGLWYNLSLFSCHTAWLFTSTTHVCYALSSDQSTTVSIIVSQIKPALLYQPQSSSMPFPGSPCRMSSLPGSVMIDWVC